MDPFSKRTTPCQRFILFIQFFFWAIWLFTVASTCYGFVSGITLGTRCVPKICIDDEKIIFEVGSTSIDYYCRSHNCCWSLLSSDQEVVDNVQCFPSPWNDKEVLAFFFHDPSQYIYAFVFVCAMMSALFMIYLLKPPKIKKIHLDPPFGFNMSDLTMGSGEKENLEGIPKFGSERSEFDSNHFTKS